LWIKIADADYAVLPLKYVAIFLLCRLSVGRLGEFLVYSMLIIHLNKLMLAYPLIFTAISRVNTINGIRALC
jgi:hypothetical protein